MPSGSRLGASVCFIVGLVSAAPSGIAAARGGPIHGVKVLSDQVEDVSSLEAIRTHMAALDSDETRASELFRMGVKFRHQITPPYEWLGFDNHVHEPVKIFNVYGYCKCCCAAAMMMALWRDNGMPARGQALTYHSVSEVFFKSSWHMFDLSVINFFLRDNGEVASVDDLVRDGNALANREHSMFVDEHQLFPGEVFRIDDDSKGLVYDATKTHEYEYLYTTGHRVSLSLRPGESITRRWSNKGLHVSLDRKLEWPLPLQLTGTQRPFGYLASYYPDYQMGLVGNGELVYEPDFGSSAWRGGVLSAVNVASTPEDGVRPALHPAVPGHAEVVIPFASSYVFLGGSLQGRFVRPSESDGVRVLVSLNHGLDWSVVWTASKTGAFEERIDLSSWLLRRYQYLLRIEITTRALSGVGVESLSLSHDIQHAQRALPLLRAGRNGITVSAPEPVEATLTLEASLTPDNRRNLTYRAYHPEVVNLDEDEGALFRQDRKRPATLTFPVSAPGPIRAIRFGGSFRARSPEDVIRLQVSDDEGRTWKEAATVRGPFAGFTHFTRFTGLEPGATRALVRYAFDGPGTLGIFVFRIDVDYTDTTASSRPVKVTYAWEEKGVERQHEQVISRYPTSYAIDAASAPLMKWIRVEGEPEDAGPDAPQGVAGSTMPARQPQPRR